MNDSIVLIYGTGGHREQAKRIYESMKDQYHFISICTHDVKKPLNEEAYSIYIPNFKYGYQEVYKLPMVMLNILSTTRKIAKKHKVVCSISTGPLLGSLALFWFKIFRIKTIFFESWSRIKTKSNAGKIAYLFVDYFFVQSEALLEQYKKAIYKGRL